MNGEFFHLYWSMVNGNFIFIILSHIEGLLRTIHIQHKITS